MNTKPSGEMMSNSEAPTIVLTSGQVLQLQKIMLYEEPPLQSAAKLRAEAAKALGGTGVGFGVFGTPNLTFAAEAAAIGVISGIIASSAQKKAFENMKQAEKYFSQAKASGRFFASADIIGVASPEPTTWSALGEPRDTEVALSTMSIADRNAYCEKHKITPSIFLETRVNVPKSVRHIHDGEDLIRAATEAGEVYFRWSQVVSFVPGK